MKKNEYEIGKMLIISGQLFSAVIAVMMAASKFGDKHFSRSRFMK